MKSLKSVGLSILLAMCGVAVAYSQQAGSGSSRSDPARADQAHARIHEVCFIARSVNFPVRYEATYEVVADQR